MSQYLWSRVDRVFTDALHTPDPILDSVLTDSAAAGLPAIQVAANQAKLLHLLAASMGARSILEIGTLGGYSTVWLARALPSDGKLITLEYEPKHAEVARANIARAGLADRVEVRVGAALDSLPVIESEGHAPFDLVFIDADKENNAAYFGWAVRLARRGALIIVDNVVRDGAIIDAAGDSRVQGVLRLIDHIAAEPRVTATGLQTVGTKGYDGLIIARVH
ncbi:MAG: O-methyltransferase [Chloroflexota bacterium]|nr:O-methyltransferase [Chloroflexota bacterium]